MPCWRQNRSNRKSIAKGVERGTALGGMLHVFGSEAVGDKGIFDYVILGIVPLHFVPFRSVEGQ